MGVKGGFRSDVWTFRPDFNSAQVGQLDGNRSQGKPRRGDEHNFNLPLTKKAEFIER